MCGSLLFPRLPGRRLAYVPSAYVFDISRLRLRRGSVIRLLSSTTTWHSTPSDLWIPSYRAARPAVSPRGSVCETREINLAARRIREYLRIPPRSLPPEGSGLGTIGSDIFIKSLRVKCRFYNFRNDSQVIPGERRCARLKNLNYILDFRQGKGLFT